MLILTRKLGESIAIGDNIKVTVLEVQGKQAKIGVEAPRDVAVNRQEVFEKIQQENLLAAETSKHDLIKISELFSIQQDSDLRRH